MKQLILDTLPAPVLLVWGLPEDAEVEETDFNVRENKYVRYWLSGKDYLEDFPEGATGNWQLIGKLSELTEEQATGLVGQPHVSDSFRPLGSTLTYPSERVWCDYTRGAVWYRDISGARDSFYSAIIEEGGNANTYEMWGLISSLIPQRKSKTLPVNTLIFKRS